MGFFKKFLKAANPVSQTKQTIKNPVQGIKNQTAITLDPAGSAVRAGTGQQPAPTNLRSMVDPTGKVLTPEQQATPNSTYTPGPMRLSPGAQAMYDQMKARMAARAAGQAYTPPAATPAPQMSAPLNAPKPQPMTTRPIETPVAAPTVPARAQSFKGLSGMPMADGGKVRSGHERSSSKVFLRKPNGKPY